MALEAVVFPQDRPFGYGTKDLYNLLGGNYSYDFGLSRDQEQENVSFESLQSQEENLLNKQWDSPPPPPIELQQMHEFNQTNWPTEVNNGTNNSSASSHNMQQIDSSAASMHSITHTKRRRQRTIKKKEDIENQRMTHIALERNRRKQFNEYLDVLRSLMPKSYVQRGDQASIIGGAINFVKELEQELHTLGAHKEMNGQPEGSTSLPFSDYFTFPQYTTNSSHHCEDSSETMANCKFSIADIEVTMVESHANLKIRSQKRPKQLLRIVTWLQNMRLTILHLNVTTVYQIVLYSLCVKVEADCKLATVDEIATAVYQMLSGTQEDIIKIN